MRKDKIEKIVEQRESIAWCGFCGNVSVDGINFSSTIANKVFTKDKDKNVEERFQEVELKEGYLKCAGCGRVGPFEYKQVIAGLAPSYL